MVKVIDERDKTTEIKRRYSEMLGITKVIVEKFGLENVVDINELSSPEALILSSGKGEKEYVAINVRMQEIIVQDRGLEDLALGLARAYEGRYGKDTFTLVQNYVD